MQTKVKLWQVFWVTVMAPPAITCLLILFGYDAAVKYSHAAQIAVYLGWGVYLLWVRIQRGFTVDPESTTEPEEPILQALSGRVQFTVSELPHERIVSIGVRSVPGAYYLVQARSFLHEPKNDVPRFITRYHFRPITSEQAKAIVSAIRQNKCLRAYAVVEIGILSRYVIYEARAFKSTEPIKEIGNMFATCAGSDSMTTLDPVKLRMIKKPDQIKV